MKRKLIPTFLLIGAAVLSLIACGGGGGKKVYFENLQDGTSLESPFKVKMKAENLIVEPATMGVNQGHGHFHIIVNSPLAGPLDPMPKDETHIHYGNGETEANLDLPVGEHTLILQFAKGDHVPYDPPVYQQVKITVTKQNKVDTAAAHVDSTAMNTDAAMKAKDPAGTRMDSVKGSKVDSAIAPKAK